MRGAKKWRRAMTLWPDADGLSVAPGGPGGPGTGGEEAGPARPGEPSLTPGFRDLLGFPAAFSPPDLGGAEAQEVLLDT
jgi:hypothetical protein